MAVNINLNNAGGTSNTTINEQATGITAPTIASSSGTSVRAEQPIGVKSLFGRQIVNSDEIAFIDRSVDTPEILLAGLRSGVEGHLLPHARDSLVAIAEMLEGRRGIEALHIIAHGAPGELRFGAGSLDVSTLARYAEELDTIAAALAPTAQVLLYGCRTGAGTEGRAFVRALSDALGVPVAASSTLIGAAAKGGNWELDVANADLAAIAPLTVSAIQIYEGIMVAIGSWSTNTTTVLEQAPAFIIDNNVTLTAWNDAATGTYVNLSVASPHAGDQLTVATTASTGVAGISVSGSNVSYVTAAGVSTLIGTIDGTLNGINGAALQINLNAFGALTDDTVVTALGQALQFQNTSNDPTTTTGRAITLTANDDNAGTVTDNTQAVTITPVNDEPTLTATAANPTFTEGAANAQGAAVAVFSGASTSTVETGQSITGLTFTVSGLVDGASESIVVDGTTITLGANSSGTTTLNAMGYTVTIAAGTATVVLSSAGETTAAITSIVNGITYQNTNINNPTPGTRTFTLTNVTDSGSNTAPNDNTTALSIVSTVTVTPVNDAPALTGDLSATVAEGGSVVIGAADLGFSDPDDVAAGVTFNVSSLVNGVVQVNGITQTTFTGTQLAAGQVTFLHNGSETATASFAVNVEDGNEDTSAPVNSTFNLTVTPQNDAPVITSTATGTEAENTAITNVVYTITATDDDNPTRTYAISGDDAGLFAVNAATGEVTFIASPNFEAPADLDANNVYDIVVHANDGTLDTTQAVAITVTNVNGAPVITSAATGAEAENTAITNVVYDINATDDGENTGTLTYSITGDDAGLFNVNATTGEVTFIASPNFEAPADLDANNVYDIVVHADDGTIDTTQAVAITVTNVNGAPVITSAATGTEAENTAITNVVYDINATDDGENTGTLTYSITGDDAGLFNVNATTGEVTFIASPNFEAPADLDANNVYDIVVHADDGTIDTTQAVAITVTNVNGAPVITSAATGTEAENTAITNVVYDINATDDGENTGTLTYSITGDDAGLFNVNATTGEVTFIASPNFEAPADLDANNVYDIIVHADDGTIDTTQAVAITVTNVNGAPVITSAATGTEAENTAITNVVYDINATDDGENTGTLTYAISGDDAGLFNVNATTGEVTFIASPNFEAPADLDANNVYDIIVHADDGTIDTTQAVAITVTNVNGAPVITSAATGTEAENTAITNVVYDINATDDGENTGTLTYAITGDDAGLFNINATTGEVTFIASPNFEAPADPDANNVYDIIVHADDGTIDTTQAVAITVTNVNGAPVITSAATGTEAENTAITNVVYDINATDDGENTGTLTYAITGDDAGLFNVNATTGEVTFIASPNFEAPADPDANNVYDIIVHADDGTIDTTQAVAITVTNVNGAPVITSAATGTEAENTAITNVVYDINATDDGENTGTLTYSITGDDAGLFNVNATTGEVTFIASPNFEAPADLDANNVYDIIVHADDGTIDTTQAVAITVTNVNGAPVITSAATGTEAENTAITNVVYDINATDDGENTGTLTYAITGDDAGLFNVNATTGEVTFIASPNFEAPADLDANNVYDIIVHADDGTIDTTQAVAITVTNVNGAPVITSAATGTEAENTAITNVVYDINATDDGENTGTLTYAISGDDAGLFNVNATTGEVTFIASPNFEAPADLDANNVYDIIVHADDGTIDTTQAVAITVTNVNGAPVITSAATGTEAENTAITNVVYDINATDDGENTGTLTYSITGDDAGLFNVNATTGEVTFIASPNFEAPADLDANNVYDIIVHADDGTIDTTQAVAITVTNVNGAPVITSAATGTEAENTAITNVVYDINATDDGENTGTLTYCHHRRRRGPVQRQCDDR